MKVSRLEAFTDGVLVIIFTIMILEFKIPNSSHITAIFKQFPYFISYTIGWLFIGEAWYNNLFILSNVKKVTHKIFFMNGLWLFTTSFLPLATAWIGKDLSAQGPEIFYAVVFLLWTLTFFLLIQTIISDNKKMGRNEQIKNLKGMRIYKYLTNPLAMSVQIIVWILLLVFAPQFQLIVMVWQIMFVAGRTNTEIDHTNRVF
ncbi:TMEM175 family protein [Fructobacillus ficulneus]|uniref:Ferrochelatase n=1 Tax=Fructobacillus ficulneus TaxID=157463 RepID=A0A0K8MIC0_9LACO|nr:TMEM175 family protein [Fructobacillus ficulneus]GAO99928.1 ferrochelatase [Fructobacillus ficulneus]